jgi:hypothetical protein
MVTEITALNGIKLLKINNRFINTQIPHNHITMNLYHNPYIHVPYVLGATT